MGIKQYKKFDKSPFHENSESSLNIKSFPIHPKGPMVNIGTGEVVTDNVYIHKHKGYRDKQPSSKLYKNKLGIINQLRMPGLKLLFYIMHEIRDKEENVYIRPTSVMNYCGYRNSKDVYKGIDDLLKNKIIARTPEATNYFINPNVLFSGNKAKLLKGKT